ncbi:MAG: hypothetical protein OEW68_04525 [Gammaproteobacteria bacterium]|nr:hypothetical protein [Gammaproteobacteria bacterium]MDH5213132.1 hypothetical protein [Gammaproteobacteria bacterium]MDH5499604.1 hypothetical protein [Gammaproteobacteria bacterium]
MGATDIDWTTPMNHRSGKLAWPRLAFAVSSASNNTPARRILRKRTDVRTGHSGNRYIAATRRGLVSSLREEPGQFLPPGVAVTKMIFALRRWSIGMPSSLKPPVGDCRANMA